MLLQVFLIASLTFIFTNACESGQIPTYTNKSLCYLWKKSGDEFWQETFLGAVTACAKKGGHLASIHKKIENMYLHEKVESEYTSDGEYWVGLNDIETPANWTWEDNTQLDYLNWDATEPSNDTDKDCGVFVQKTGKWAARDCSVKKYFLCLVPAILPKTTTTTTTPQPSG